ncbi:metallophosphoesterase [Raineya orbicola]|uniref:Calcineurin-like phosphoesterase n=1 Tax=Raineya orbicola TaxID=2016530 RepID=A0A2N3IJI5_9BACT|nr:metallophosphoesterase [Raineya orbicola]PKQ70393.1 Calcineurin-like phosphoesterase [Raineya orbicola]
MTYLIPRFLTILFSLLLIDYITFRALKVALRDATTFKRKLWFRTYWIISAFCLVSIALYFFGIFKDMSPLRVWVQGFVSVAYISKIFVVFFVLFEDIIFYTRKLFAFFRKKVQPIEQETGFQGKKISRAKFIHQAGLIAGAIPMATLSWGIISGAHDYQVRRRKIYLPHLPKSFEGFTIAQISDIHSGSFYNKTAVKGGVEMLLAEKPNLILFTGDLVNNHPDEMKEYVSVFDKLKADFGVFSVMGNHDYGDYIFGITAGERAKLRKKLHEVHKAMNWRLLLDENAFIEENREKIAIIGVQNWGTGNFPKYGNLTKAYQGTDEASVKILLSHDPSHWDAQIRPEFSDIDLTLSGHTHGMQLGIEYGDFRWSPVQYRYKQWADLYQEKNRQGKTQYLYVNRGFGYIGYLGRVGILPEITILTLTAQA